MLKLLHFKIDVIKDTNQGINMYALYLANCALELIVSK